MKKLIRKILKEEVGNKINYNPTVIFIAGCSSEGECGKKYKYSHEEQGNMLQSALGSNFNVITLSHVTSPLSEIKKHNNPYVVMFSAGGNHSNSVANEIKNTEKDLNKIYIAEPYTCGSKTLTKVNSAITTIGNNNNVYGGKTDCTGKNVAGKIDSKSTHWSALTTVGKDIKSTWERGIEKKQIDKIMGSIEDSDTHRYSDTLHPNNIKEDLEYWSVSNASPDSDEYEMGITEDIPIYKDHNLGKEMYGRLRKAFPMTPEYILKDFFYNNIVNEFETIEKEFYGDPLLFTRGYWGEFLKGPWKLEILNVNPLDFDDKTINAFLERDFGNVDSYQVPNDEERTQTQRNIAKGDGTNEPIIVERKPNGKYELIEGWHRTMSILLLGDNGEDLKNWDKVKIRAFVRDLSKLPK